MLAEKVKIEEGWREALSEEFSKPYFDKLTAMVRAEYSNPAYDVYPPAGSIFAAFDASPFARTKVVIIGQDPYHGPGQANGLCFSVNPGVDFPPSLRNIFKEVSEDTGAPIPANGDLTRWAEQGVLMLNSSLTVRAHTPRSHAGIGWEIFTDAAVHAIAEKREHIVFILWGSDAIRKGAFIDRGKHLVLTSAHPSPLSAYRGFFGNHHFSRANQYLVEHGEEPIQW
jgi:uracil-DNA glycosylase